MKNLKNKQTIFVLAWSMAVIGTYILSNSFGWPLIVGSILLLIVLYDSDVIDDWDD